MQFCRIQNGFVLLVLAVAACTTPPKHGVDLEELHRSTAAQVATTPKEANPIHARVRIVLPDRELLKQAVVKGSPGFDWPLARMFVGIR